jgi:prepilin-type N-terminal cleavage/methylation domain-containing protein/prepilin-type processing-associated H-X9-DG protein
VELELALWRAMNPERIMRKRCGFTLIETLVVIAIVAVLAGLLLPAIQRVRDVGYRAKCSNQVKQLGLALQSCHANEGYFPAGVRGKNTPQPFVSWITPILPYVDQQALWQKSKSAFSQDRVFFHNPPHVALDTVLSVLNCPADGRGATPQRVVYGYDVALTSYLGVSGTDTDAENGMLYLDSRVSAKDVVDGLSNTLMLGERPPSANLLLGWWYAGTGPDYRGTGDMILGVREFGGMTFQVGCPYEVGSFSPGSINNTCDSHHFWSLHFGGANFGFADGSVRFLAYSADHLMPALATRAGGEVVAVPD